jgi:hypothetical protein
MIKEFKFFRSNITRVNWQLTGLLDDATNVPLLIGVLDITWNYILDNNLMDNERVKNTLIIVMTKLYRDKYLRSYSDYDIRGKIDEVITYMNSVAVRRMVQEIQANAFMTVDIEAETNHIIYERCKWDEDTVGDVFHNNADITLTFRRND